MEKLTLGQLLGKAINDYGIGGYVLDLECDVHRDLVRVWTPMYDSSGEVALDESRDDVVRVLWEVPMHSAHP